MRRFLAPLAGLGVVATLATVLIGIVLRSPDTHGNLWETIPAEYRRTALEIIGHGGSHLAMAGEPSAHPSAHREGISEGRVLYLGHGCATCHGLNAEGGPVGPSLAGSLPEIVKRIVREGPGGMTAHSEAYLTDADLGQMAAYLEELKVVKPSADEIATLLRITYDPATPLDLLLKGKAALRRSCGACHVQPSKEEILSAFGSDSLATGLVAQMVQNANVSLEDGKTIAHYMMAILHGADPVKER